MKTRILITLITPMALLSLLSGLAQAAPLGTAFTYQGRLQAGGEPASGAYDLKFTLYDAATGGSPVGSPLTHAPVAVTNGHFSVWLDFGAVFTGEARWLEIGVRTNGSTGSYGAPSARQALTPAPYALYTPTAGAAATAASATSVASNGVSAMSLQADAVTSDKIANGTVTESDLSPTLTSNTFWRLGGNAGTSPGAQFLGTADEQPLELAVNSTRALRLEPNAYGAPNVIAGAPINWVADGVVGATIAGGGATNDYGHAHSNSVAADYGSIGGGLGNVIQSGAEHAAIAGGHGNLILSNATAATISGGQNNQIAEWALYSGIGGGSGNRLSGMWSFVGGGLDNWVQDGSGSSMIGVGQSNQIGTNAHHCFIGGGEWNRIGFGARYSFIGGGWKHSIQSNALFSTIAGGSNNVIEADAKFTTIPGGFRNNASGSFSLAAGRQAKALHDGVFVWADSTDADYASTGSDQFCLRASGGLHLSPDTSLYCGSQLRQMMNLWGASYGLGVQNNTFYSRSGDRFCWYRNGVHTNAAVNPGTGGTWLMTLDGGGSLFTAGGIYPSSDRNVKTNFAAIEPREILARLVAVPIQTWSYQSEGVVRHIGPVAQDFRAAFGLGSDDKHIATVDADGVALAAIQGLHQKLKAQAKEKDARIEALEKDVAQLKQLVRMLLPDSNGGGQ